MASPLPEFTAALQNTSSPEPGDAGSEIFVARQPILDSGQNVFAYELLYRSSWKNAYDGVSSSIATTDVILNALLHIGMDRLVGGKPAFVNFDRELLLGNLVGLLPPNIVIEVLESVTPDQDVVARCRELRKQGFKIALDDVTDLGKVGELITVADFVKVDFRAASHRDQEIVARSAIQRSIRTLAEKVETSEEFERALKLGYKLAQGYFFAKPKIIPGSKIPPNKLAFLRLLHEINKPEPDIHKIEETLRREPALVYKLLRYINSAAFGWKRPIDSIRHALALLGTEQIQKWIGLLALAALTDRAPASLAPAAIFRARFCELIATAAGLRNRSPELFLLGMLSLFEAILRRPMEEIIEQIELNDDVRGALLKPGQAADKIGTIYALVTAYETGSWEIVDECAARLGLSRQGLSTGYQDSVLWAEDMGKM
ncbi:MAG TPA: HDOD domain-containing protein [Bryobacteraceae bacterium]|nr:HDOD domain-containing protein [Bryobacteraceae bacterium]